MRRTLAFSFLMVALSMSAHALAGAGDSETSALDTVSPSLQSVSALTEHSLSATFSEPMLAPGATMPGNYEVSGAGAGSLSANPDGVSGSGPYALSWSAGEMLDGASITITATGLQDVVGNPIDPALSSASGDGLGIPPVFSNLSANPLQAHRGETVMITFAVSEPLANDPNVSVNGHEAALIDGGKLIDYIYEYVVLESDPLGAATVSVTGADLVGNLGSLDDTAALEIIEEQPEVPLHAWPVGMTLLAVGVLALVWRRRHVGVLLIVAALLASSPAFAQGPTVSNVAFTQTPNGALGTKVDITYDLDAPAGSCNITAMLSKDGGTDEFPFPIASATGDTGVVTSGAGKHIVWDVAADYPDEAILQARIRVAPDVIGPEGGTLVFGPWLLEFPAGAVDDLTQITGVPASGYPPNAGIVGTPYTFGSTGLDLVGRGVRISSTYDPGALGGAAEDDLAIAAADTGWTVLASSTASPDTDSVSAGIESLSTFSLVNGTATGLVVPPMIRNLAVSVDALPTGITSPVTLTWDYALPPTSAVTSTLDAAPVTSGVPVNLTRSEGGTFTLLCTNAEGADSQTVRFAESAAPVLHSFVASPALAPYGVPTAITLSWSYDGEPVPAPACTIAGIGEVTNGETVTVTLMPPLQLTRTFNLTCTNNAGADTQSVTVTGVTPWAIPMSLGTGATHFDLGFGISLDVPDNALTAPANFTVAFDTGTPPNPNQVGLAITCTPFVWFQNPVTLTLPYDESLLTMFGPDVATVLQNLGIAALDQDDNWVPLHTEIDAANHTLTITINELTSFAIVANALTNGYGYGAKSDWQQKASHPLRYETSRLVNVAELALGMPRAIPRPGGSGGFLVWDHDAAQIPSSKTYLTESASNFPPIEEKVWGSLGGDFDNDGLDEIAVLGTRWDHNSGSYAVWYLALTVFDDAEHGFVQKARWTTLDHPLGPVTAGSTYSYYDADLDVVRLKDYEGVSREFLLVTGSYGRMNTNNVPVYHENNNSWMLDLGTGTLRQVAEWPKACDLGVPTYETRTAAGDLDGSGQDTVFWAAQSNSNGRTFVIGFDLRWQDANTLRRSGSAKMSPYYQVFSGSANRPSIACGDFDGDYTDELAFFAYNTANGQFQVDIWKARGTWTRLLRKTTTTGGGGWGNGTPHMMAEDVDNDQHDELVFNPFEKSGGNPSTISKLWWLDYNDNHWGTIQSNSMKHCSFAMGNTDADLFAELQTLYKDPSANRYIYHQFNRDSGSWVKSYDKTFARSSTSSYQEPWIAAGDFDGDSTVVRYLGEWKFDRSDILPICAIAYPPYWEPDTVQDSDNTEAAIQFGTEASTETSNSLGITSGASVSVETGDPLEIVTAEAQVSFEREFTLTNTQSKSTSSAVTFTANQGEDCVVSQYMYWDHYRYRVVACRTASQVDKTIVIDVPRGKPIMGIDIVSYYNGANGNAPDLGLETFANTIGCPTSYPAAPYAGSWSSDLYHLGVGGSVTLELSESQGTSTVTENTWSITMEAGMSVAGIGFKSSVGVNGGDSYSFTMAKDTTYSGTVGGVISQPDNSEYVYVYDFGLFVRTLTHPSYPGLRYQLINFWTENFSSSAPTCP